MKNTLLIGMKQIDITPPAPVNLRGQFHARISRYVESPLLAQVFAAESGGEQILICACDLIAIHDKFCAQIRDLIRRRHTGIDPSKIIFCATHTHTGPAYYQEKDPLHVAADYLPANVSFVDEEVFPEGTWLEEQCGDFLAGKMCQVICDAWASRVPACYSPSFGRAVTGHCRRVVYTDDSAKMYGATDTATFQALEGGNDSGIELLYIFHADGQPMGALVNAACPSQCVEMEYFISSDFWGKARDRIKQDLGEDFVVVGLCSAAGDQSPRDLIRRNNQKARLTDPDMYGLAGAKELGERIARVVIDQFAAAKNSTRDEAIIRHQNLTLDFPLRQVTIKAYEAAQRSFDDYIARSGKTVFTPEDMAALHIFAGIMERYHIQESCRFYSAEIHVARFADMAIATNPFELFLDYGNQIRARSEATQTMLIQLACSDGGYLPTQKAENGSHYSAYVSSGKTGHAGGELLVQKTIDVISQLWEA